MSETKYEPETFFRTKYEPETFFRVALSGAASEISEAIGAMMAYHAVSERRLADYSLGEIERAVARASAAIANYKRAIGAGRKLMTLKEFEAPH